MSAPHGVTAELVASVRISQYQFLRSVAPGLWAEQMRQGINFLVPEEIAHFDVDARARWLAHAEAKRLAQAALFHLDERGTEWALRQARESVHQGYTLTPGMLPATFGFLMWSAPVATGSGNSDVVAVHWEVREDAVWTAWWTDTATHVQHQLDRGAWTARQAELMRSTYGPLLYERERLLPFATAAALEEAPDREMDAWVNVLTHVTVASWRILADSVVALREVMPAPQDQQRGAELKLSGGPVLTTAPETAQHPTARGQPDHPTDARSARGGAAVPEQFAWLEDLNRAYRDRLEQYEQQVEQRYTARVWDQLAAARSGVHDLPGWCWLPIGTALDVVANNASHVSGVTPLQHGSVLAALAAWRHCGRPVFLPHEDLRPEPDLTRLVEQIFERLRDGLPELCSYMALPAGEGTAGARGYFVHLEWDCDLRQPQIRLLLDHNPDGDLDTLLPQPIDVLNDVTLAEAVDETWRKAGARAELLLGAPELETTRRRALATQQTSHLAHLLAMAIFVGGDDAVFTPLDVVLQNAGGARAAGGYRPRSGRPGAPVTLVLVASRAMYR